MVLISIAPFSFKKTFLLVVALLGLSSALCFADPLFMSSQFARHDRQSHRFSSAASSATLQSETALSARTEEETFDSALDWLPCNSE
jgi:hypothetical protein